MKKFVLPIALFIFLFIIIVPGVYAQSTDCWKEYSDIQSICIEATTKRNSCTESDLNSPCYQDGNKLLDKCDQANNTFHECLGVDKNPWRLQSNKPGHLTCQEWKNLGIVGTAQNCVAPVTETFERKLWCLSSAADIGQVRSYPVDYILDFDPNSCITTEDDVRQFKAGLPITSESSPEQKNQPKKDEENLFKKALGGFPVFIGEWFRSISTGIDLREFFTGSKVIADKVFVDYEVVRWEEEQKKQRDDRLDQELKDLLDKTPKLEKTDGKKMEKQSGQSDSPFRLDILNGQAQIKYLGESEWRDIKAGDQIPNGSTLFTGMDATTVLSIQDKGVLQVLPFTEITVSEWGLEQATTNKKITTDINLRTGEIELNVEGGAFTAGSSMQVNAAYTTSSVRGTHFWIKHDDKKKVDVVGVYEGKVEVKTNKDGQTMTVIPNGNKPGIVLVSQKLLIWRLALVGLVFIAIIGGAIFFWKRKGVGKSTRQKVKKK